MTAHRISLSLITGVLGVSDRPGDARGDNEHTTWATLLITDLARIYEGALNHPFGPDRNEMPPSQPEPAPPEPGGHSAVIVTFGEVKTLLAALDIAADYKRDRAETCTDCTSQSCLSCQSRLRDAQAYDHPAAQLIQAAQAARTSSRARRVTP